MNVRVQARVVLLVAILLGLITAVIIVAYVKAKTKPAPVVTRPEVVATQDIPSGTVITSTMLRVRQVPPAYVVPGAATAAAPLLGGIVKQDISPGEPVLLSEVASGTAGSGLAFIIPAGDVAMTVAVDALSGQDGMLRPGDRVDVLAIVNSGAGVKADSVATALQGVQVLAVGDATAPASAAKAGYATATLAVNLQEAEEIAYIEHFATLSLTLVAPAQTGGAPVSPFTQGSMAGVTG